MNRQDSSPSPGLPAPLPPAALSPAPPPAPVEEGYLTVQVRTAGGAYPVPGARVSILPVNRNAEAVVLFTDSSGNTPLLSLPAPPARSSLTPNGGVTSFAYHIITDAPGFLSVQNLNVPIYAGVTAIQQVLLIPFPDQGQTPPTPNDQTRFNESGKPDL